MGVRTQALFAGVVEEIIEIKTHHPIEIHHSIDALRVIANNDLTLLVATFQHRAHPVVDQRRIEVRFERKVRGHPNILALGPFEVGFVRRVPEYGAAIGRQLDKGHGRVRATPDHLVTFFDLAAIGGRGPHGQQQGRHGHDDENNDGAHIAPWGLIEPLLVSRLKIAAACDITGIDHGQKTRKFEHGAGSLLRIALEGRVFQQLMGLSRVPASTEDATQDGIIVLHFDPAQRN